MKIPTPSPFLLVAALCLCGMSASANLIDLTFEGQFTHTYDYSNVNPDESYSDHWTDSGEAILQVTVDVPDTGVLHRSSGAGDFWEFQGTVVSFSLNGEPPFETATLAEEMEEGLGRIGESNLRHLVEGTYSLDNSGFGLAEGSMYMDAYATGTTQVGNVWTANSIGISFFLEGVFDTSGLNAFQGYFAHNVETLVDYGLPARERIPENGSSYEVAQTWDLDLSLTDYRVRPVVPEPTSALLLGLGAIVPLLRRLRTR